MVHQLFLFFFNFLFVVHNCDLCQGFALSIRSITDVQQFLERNRRNKISDLRLMSDPQSLLVEVTQGASLPRRFHGGRKERWTPSEREGHPPLI